MKEGKRRREEKFGSIKEGEIKIKSTKYTRARKMEKEKIFCRSWRRAKCYSAGHLTDRVETVKCWFVESFSLLPYFSTVIKIEEDLAPLDLSRLRLSVI